MRNEENKKDLCKQTYDTYKKQRREFYMSLIKNGYPKCCGETMTIDENYKQNQSR